MAGLRALGVAAVLLTASLAGTSARQPLGPEETRARLHAYLSVYEEELRTVVAEERMLQWPMREAGSTYLGATGGTVRRDSSRIRILESDVAFVSLPGNAGWLRYRDVRRVGVPAFTAVVTVEFERNANLGLTVPVRMRELFFIPQRSSGEGEATYANYRRFTTAGRLVPGRD